jgi:hypothetical protein
MPIAFIRLSISAFLTVFLLCDTAISQPETAFLYRLTRKGGITISGVHSVSWQKDSTGKSLHFTTINGLQRQIPLSEFSSLEEQFPVAFTDSLVFPFITLSVKRTGETTGRILSDVTFGRHTLKGKTALGEVSIPWEEIDNIRVEAMFSIVFAHSGTIQNPSFKELAAILMQVSKTGRNTPVEIATVPDSLWLARAIFTVRFFQQTPHRELYARISSSKRLLESQENQNRSSVPPSSETIKAFPLDYDLPVGEISPYTSFSTLYGLQYEISAQAAKGTSGSSTILFEGFITGAALRQRLFTNEYVAFGTGIALFPVLTFYEGKDVFGQAFVSARYGRFTAHASYSHIIYEGINSEDRRDIDQFHSALTLKGRYQLSDAFFYQTTVISAWSQNEPNAYPYATPQQKRKGLENATITLPGFGFRKERFVFFWGLLLASEPYPFISVEFRL